MNKLASIVLNWIGGGKTPIPVRFLKSIDVPGNAPTPTPTPQSEMHILEITNGDFETNSLEELQSVMTFDSVPITQEDAVKITPLNTIIRYSNIDMTITTMMYPRTQHYKEIDIYAGCNSAGDHSLETANEIKIVLDFQDDTYIIQYNEI